MSFLKVTAFSLCPSPAHVPFGLISYKRRGGKGRLFITVEMSREVSSAVRKAACAGMWVPLRAGGPERGQRLEEERGLCCEVPYWLCSNRLNLFKSRGVPDS